jgi:hypothetical protein
VTLHHDFETRGVADLEEVGLDNYAFRQTTRAYSFLAGSSMTARFNCGRNRFEALHVHQDDIVRGRIDVAAVRRREEAELKPLIAASQKPCRPATKCDHERSLSSQRLTLTCWVTSR